MASHFFQKIKWQKNMMMRTLCVLVAQITGAQMIGVAQKRKYDRTSTQRAGPSATWKDCETMHRSFCTEERPLPKSIGCIGKTFGTKLPLHLSTVRPVSRNFHALKSEKKNRFLVKKPFLREKKTNLGIFMHSSLRKKTRFLAKMQPAES